MKSELVFKVDLDDDRRRYAVEDHQAHARDMPGESRTRCTACGFSDELYAFVLSYEDGEIQNAVRCHQCGTGESVYIDIPFPHVFDRGELRPLPGATTPASVVDLPHGLRSVCACCGYQSTLGDFRVHGAPQLPSNP